MFWTPFKATANACLGIDIGTSSIKIVEIREKGKEKELSNYGEMKVGEISSDFKKNIIQAESQEIADVIEAILTEAKIKSKTAVFSLPDYSSFFANFNLPAMTKEEIPEAVKYEAPVHIPLPLAEVTLDWQVVEGLGKENRPLKILSVAVPNEIINKYREIASLAKLEPITLEAEVFGLIRALIKEDLTEAILDIGAESTTCSIIDKRILKISHSFDSGGKKLTEQIAKTLNLEDEEAEKLKKENGISGEKSIRESLIPVLDIILGETKQVCKDFSEAERKAVNKLVLAGGSALLPGLKEYLAENLNLKVEIADPFLGLISSPVLAKTLSKMGPLYAVAVGVALRGLK